jgi:ribosomal protein L13E
MCGGGEDGGVGTRRARDVGILVGVVDERRKEVEEEEEDEEEEGKEEGVGRGAWLDAASSGSSNTAT